MAASRSLVQRVAALLLAASGILLMATPRFLFPVCGYSPLVVPAMGGMMRCSTTATLTISSAGATLLLAAAIWSCRNPLLLRRLLYATAIVSATPFLFFLVWPGVCRAATMPCRSGSMPAALLISGARVVIALAPLWIGARQRDA